MSFYAFLIKYSIIRSLTFSLLFLLLTAVHAFGQRSSQLAEKLVESLSIKHCLDAYLDDGDVENISDRTTMILKPMDYRIDSIIQYVVFPQFSSPDRPQFAFGYTFSGTDTNTRVIEERVYTYDFLNGDFSGQRSRRLLDYNQNRQLISEKYEELHSGSWVEVERFEFTYNSQGHLETFKEFTTAFFSLGDSIVYRYSAEGLIESLDIYERMVTVSPWVNVLNIENITYENGKEKAMEILMNDGSGAMVPSMRFVDLEWDLGYFPFIDRLVSFLVSSYTPKLFGNAKIMYPSKVTIEDNVGGNWYTRTKSELVGQMGNVYEMYEAIVLGFLPVPSTDTIFYQIHANNSGDLFYVSAEVNDSNGVSLIPYFKDTIANDVKGNQTLFKRSFYNINNQRFQTSGKVERVFSYGANNVIDEIDYTEIDRFGEQHLRFELFGFNRISTNRYMPKTTFDMFPNPASDQIKINFEDQNDQWYKIIGMDGRLMQSGMTQNGLIYLDEIPSGVYVLHLESGFRKKVVVKK